MSLQCYDCLVKCKAAVSLMQVGNSGINWSTAFTCQSSATEVFWHSGALQIWLLLLLLSTVLSWTSCPITLCQQHLLSSFHQQVTYAVMLWQTTQQEYIIGMPEVQLIPWKPVMQVCCAEIVSVQILYSFWPCNSFSYLKHSTNLGTEQKEMKHSFFLSWRQHPIVHGLLWVHMQRPC